MSKRKGTRIEYKIIELLEVIGFKCIRSAGSHGPFDIVAMMDGMVWLIQSKANRKPSSVEIEEMRMWPGGDKILKAYSLWKDREKYPEFYWEWEWGE